VRASEQRETFTGSSRMLPKRRRTLLRGCALRSAAPGFGGHGKTVDSITGGCEEAMAVSIFADIQRIAARALS
jgi:hypothetical protein